MTSPKEIKQWEKDLNKFAQCDHVKQDVIVPECPACNMAWAIERIKILESRPPLPVVTEVNWPKEFHVMKNLIDDKIERISPMTESKTPDGYLSKEDQAQIEAKKQETFKHYKLMETPEWEDRFNIEFCIWVNKLNNKEKWPMGSTEIGPPTVADMKEFLRAELARQKEEMLLSLPHKWKEHVDKLLADQKAEIFGKLRMEKDSCPACGAKLIYRKSSFEQYEPSAYQCSSCKINIHYLRVAAMNAAVEENNKRIEELK